MSAVLSLIVVLGLSFFITRVAAIALTLTGLSHDTARFQAVSAFTGVGFTTREAERVLEQPVRRRIVLTLMVLGNAGVIAAVSSLILSFTDLQAGQWWHRALWIAGGVVLIWAIRSSESLGRVLDRLTRRILKKTTRLRVADYDRLLDLTGDYEVSTMQIRGDDWLQGQHLNRAELFQEGVIVLGIHRKDGEYLGIPRGETDVKTGDRLVLYGASQILRDLEERRKGASGDAEHDRAKADHRRDRSRQKSREMDSGESSKESLPGPQGPGGESRQSAPQEHRESDSNTIRP